MRPAKSLRLAMIAVGFLLGGGGCTGSLSGTGSPAGPGSGGSTGGASSSEGSGGGTGSGGAAAGGSSGAAGTGGATGGGGAAGSGGPGGSGGLAGAGGSVGTGGTAGGGGAAAQPFKGTAGIQATCTDLTRLGASWFYNWTTSPSGCTAVPFVPMISGKNEKTGAAVTTALTGIASAGYKTVLAINEPNKTDQANLTVAQVLALWPQMTANAAIRVSSPATSADSAGQSWFTDFLTQATAQNLRIDFIALHWYGWNAGSCDAKAAGLESYIKWAEGLPGNRPIWITEFGCLNQSNPDAATVQAFYSGAVAMFQRHPRIERYAWYPFTTNNELVTSGALTSLGTAFAGAAATK